MEKTTQPADLLAEALQRWEDSPHSAFAHHGQGCCDRAQLWLTAMDASMRGATPPAAGPRWLRVRYQWGPTVWPLYWCEAVGRKELDCGALAWMTRAVYEARGVKAFPVQLVQRYNSDAVPLWAERWHEACASTHWLCDSGYIYHEVCAVGGAGNAIRIWDPSAGWWIDDPSADTGYGSIAALRLLDPLCTGDCPEYQWGSTAVVPGRWTALEA